VVSDRSSLSSPLIVGVSPPAYFWGFAGKLTRSGPSAGVRCELHWCPDKSCSVFEVADVLALKADTTTWQELRSSTAKPSRIDTPWGRVVCFGHAEPNGPEVHYDRFYVGTEPTAF
jgi:hypothetical protein